MQSIAIVDDDASIRESLIFLMRSIGWRATAYATAHDFLERANLNEISCVILDVRMPGPSGLEIVSMIRQRGFEVPAVFLTGYGDIPMSVQAMRDGAVDFLTKPFREQDLIDAVNRASAKADAERFARGLNIDCLRRYDTLTGRERDVFWSVVQGRMNKQIAHELGISVVTVKIHRGNVMQKMAVKSLADLVRTASIVGPSKPPGSVAD